MKLLLLTLCVIAVTHADGDVRWDPSGQYRILVTEPVEDDTLQEFKINTEPMTFKLETTPFIKKYNVVNLDSFKFGSWPYLSYPYTYSPYRVMQPGYSMSSSYILRAPNQLF